MRKLVVAVLAGLAFALVACGSESGSDSTDSTSNSLKGGCRMICPKCHPGEVCPMYACVEDCNGKPAKCVDNQLCPIGYAWDSTACSCEPTTTCVDTQMCIVGYVWDATQCACVPQ